MAIFVIFNEHGGESVTGLADERAVLVGSLARTDGITDGADIAQAI
jgi:hypothetical protein